MAKLKRVLAEVIDSLHEMDDFKYQILEKLKDNLDEYHNIPSGKIEYILSQEPADLIEEEDIKLLAVFVKKFLELSGNKETLKQTFTVAEIKELEQYYYHDKEVIALPLEMYPALKLNSTTHSVRMTAKMVAQLLEEQVLNYGFEIQREAKLVKKQGKIIKQPRINQKNVDEMAELLIKGQLMDSTIFLNAAPRTADDGEELLMNEGAHKLTVAEGTRLDILDGFHRCLASQKAYQLNPNIDFYFNVVISNYTTKEAQLWQAQHAKAMPWSQQRIRELQKESRSDKVVAALRANPDVGDYISTSRKMYGSQIVSFSVLSDAIDKYFKLENRRDEVDTIELIARCLDDLAQYDGLEWGTDRSQNILISKVGIVSIVYYTSLHKEDYNTKNFYNFLDKLIENKDKISEAVDGRNLNTSNFNNSQINKIKQIVKEAS